MTYRIVAGALALTLCALAIMLAPTDAPTAQQQQANPPAQLAPTPTQKSEDDSLKGFKIPN